MSIATVLEPRPRKLPDAARMKIAREISQELAELGLLDDEASIELSASAISRHARMGMDGYELAKEIELHCGWSLNLQIAQILDSFDDKSQTAIDDLQKEWAIRNNIQPPYPVGTRVLDKRGWDERCGVIVEIYNYGPAKYVVRLDGQSATTGAIVNFEDVTTELSSQPS